MEKGKGMQKGSEKRRRDMLYTGGKRKTGIKNGWEERNRGRMRHVEKVIER